MKELKNSILKDIPSKEEKEFINQNYRLLTLIGIITVFINDIEIYIPDEQRHKFDFIKKDIENVIYNNKPLSYFEEYK